MTRRADLVCLAFLALAGCGHSREPLILTLDPHGPASAPSPPAGSGIGPVRVGPVILPATLDRPEVVRQDRANTLAVDDFARWGAPLAVLARETLSDDLSARLPNGTVRPFGVPAAAGTATLWVVFDAVVVRDGALLASGSWIVRRNPGGASPVPRRQCAFRLTIKMSGADSVATADALSRILAMVADQIAADLSSEG